MEINGGVYMAYDKDDPRYLENKERTLRIYHNKRKAQEQKDKEAHRQCGFWETPNDPRW